MAKFKIADKIEMKDGTNFSSGFPEDSVKRVEFMGSNYSGEMVWLLGAGTRISADSVRLISKESKIKEGILYRLHEEAREHQDNAKQYRKLAKVHEDALSEVITKIELIKGIDFYE